VLEHIAEQQPDILLVGMGTPRQELWVERNFDRIDTPVVWTVGALFDYLSGRTPRAPHWMADHGFEWIFRLALEPRRMWRRYLLGNPAFLGRVLSEARRRRDAG
jgi:N-acetylglucosaminyldiphosphoundecaprenol N-acetyl-beta-D-mannosaminyltransferase